MSLVCRIGLALVIASLATGAQACAYRLDELDQAFADADTDHTNTLSTEEYFASFTKTPSKERQRSIFSQLDKNHDGVLSRKEYDIPSPMCGYTLKDIDRLNALSPE